MYHFRINLFLLLKKSASVNYVKQNVAIIVNIMRGAFQKLEALGYKNGGAGFARTYVIEVFEGVVSACYKAKIREHHKSEIGEVIAFLRKVLKIEAEYSVRLVPAGETAKKRGLEVSVDIELDRQFDRQHLTSRGVGIGGRKRDKSYDYAYVVSCDRIVDDPVLKKKCLDSLTKFLVEKSIQFDYVGEAVRIGSDQFKSLIAQQSKISELELEARDLEPDLFKVCHQLVESEDHAAKIMEALKAAGGQRFTLDQLRVIDELMRKYLRQTGKIVAVNEESVAVFRAERAEALLKKGFPKKEITTILDMDMSELEAIEARRGIANKKKF